MKEMTRRQNGEENGNMALLEKFPQALFGKFALRDIAEGWNDEGDFQEHPSRRIPAFRMIMMTIKRTRDLNQTIDLVRSLDEAEANRRGDSKTRNSL